MENKIKAIHHISLKPVGKQAFDETVHFYRDFLGFPVVREWEKNGVLGIMLAVGESLMEINSDGEEKLGLGAINHFAFATDAVDELAERIRRASSSSIHAMGMSSEATRVQVRLLPFPETLNP